MVKKETCLYLDADVIKACKEQGINMSRIAEKALHAVLVGSHFRNEEAHLEFLYSQREQEKRRFKEREGKFLRSRERLIRLDEQIKRQEKLVEVVRSSRQVASIIAAVNEVIKSYNFDVELAWKECESLVAELDELHHPVTHEWFEKQVERLKSGFI